MFAKYILIILFCFAFTKSYAQTADGLRLNVRLYPVQMLAIGAGFSDDENESFSQEIQSVTISSPSGFQLNAHYDEYRNMISTPESRSERSDEYRLINYHKGVVEKRYMINNEMQNAIKNLGTDRTDEPNFLVLTLISQ